MIWAARSSSPRRTAAMSAAISGLSMAGLRMSPASPPVQVTSTVRTPSAWYRATVPGPFEASSSGWACTVMRQRRESGIAGHATGRGGPRRRATGTRARPGTECRELDWTVVPREPRRKHQMDSPEQWRWIWLAATAVFAIGEMATPGSFFLAPFAVGALVASLLAFAGVSVLVEWIVFIVVSLIMLALLRPLSR